jgi:hypothetical protein
VKPSETFPHFWDILLRIQVSLGINSKKFSSLMQLPEKDFLKMKGYRLDPPIRNTLFLAEALNLSFDHLITGKIDYTTLTQQFLGHKDYLPEKYCLAAYGKRRIALGLLNYIETHHGWTKRAQLLRHFQISEAAFSNPEAPINLRFSIDAVEWMFQYFRSYSVLETMGQKMVTGMSHQPFRDELKPTRNLAEFFEALFGGILEKHVEKNFLWKIQTLNGQSLRVRGYPNPEVAEASGTECVQSFSGLVVRKGMLSALPTYLNYSPAPVKIIRQFDDRPYCELELELDTIVQMKKSRHLFIAS